jgi:hypothetical protein
MQRRSLFFMFSTAAVLTTFSWLAVGEFKRKQAQEKPRKPQEEARELIDSIPHVNTTGMVGRIGMPAFLHFWNDEVLLRLRRARFPLDKQQQEVVAKGGEYSYLESASVPWTNWPNGLVLTFLLP